MTNIIFMTPGSQVMELLPKGWLRYAGVSQKAFEWISNWVGLVHEGYWEDTEGPECPFPEIKGDIRCIVFFKNREVGLNATHLARWTRNVLRRSADTKRQKVDILQNQIDANQTQQQYCACGTDTVSYKVSSETERRRKYDLELRTFFNWDLIKRSSLETYLQESRLLYPSIPQHEADHTIEGTLFLWKYVLFL